MSTLIDFICVVQMIELHTTIVKLVDASKPFIELVHLYFNAVADTQQI